MCIQNICLWIDIKFIWLIFYIITGKGHLVQCFSTFYHIIRYSPIPNNFLQISLSSNLILLLSSKSRLVCPKWTRDKRMKDSTIHRRGSPNYRFFLFLLILYTTISGMYLPTCVLILSVNKRIRLVVSKFHHCQMQHRSLLQQCYVSLLYIIFSYLHNICRSTTIKVPPKKWLKLQ